MNWSKQKNRPEAVKGIKMEKTIKDVVAETVAGLVDFYVDTKTKPPKPLNAKMGAAPYIREELPYRGGSFDVEINHGGIKLKFKLNVYEVASIEASEQQRQI